LFTEACQNGAFGGISGKTYDTYLDTVNALVVPEDKTFCPFLFPIQYAKAMNSGNMNVQITDHNFRNDLIKIHRELRVPIVLLFDEGNVLAQSRVLLQKLRNVFMNTPGFMLVMTGTPDLFPVMDEVFSPIVRQFKKIPVGEFRDLDDTRECITKPLEKLGITPWDIINIEDVIDIHNLSGGRPYEIQLICHTLFRHVQDKRAKKMKLNFSVLDEVRKELETLQDITSRPILTKVRNLNGRQLAAMSILCFCDGRATFDQLWSIEYIFNGESSWTKNDLESMLNLLVDEGILKLEDGIISFTGDDFDKIYAKYFATEENIKLDFSQVSITARWKSGLKNFLDLHLKNRLEEIFSTLRTHQSGNNILEIIYKLVSASGDVFVDMSPLAEEIYMKMVEYRDQATFPIIMIDTGLSWINRQLYFCSMKKNDAEALKIGTELISSLEERIAKLGGSLIVETLELPIVSLSILINEVEHTANKRARLSIERFHTTEMYNLYTKKLINEALFHADMAYRFNPEPNLENSNNIGYLFLSADDYDRAEVLFERAISLSKSNKLEEANDDEEDENQMIYQALPIYNLGVVRAKRGQLECAKIDFQSSINLSQVLKPEERELRCLWVPVVDNNILIFEERDDPNILESSETAKASVEYILALKGNSDGI